MVRSLKRPSPTGRPPLAGGPGVGLALLFGGHPGYGLFAGSISFAGGHGTAIAWGAEATAADDAAGRAVDQLTASFDHKSNATGNTGGRANPAPAPAACSSLGAALPRPKVISSLIPSTPW